MTFWSPDPKCLLTPRMRTATSGLGLAFGPAAFGGEPNMTSCMRTALPQESPTGSGIPHAGGPRLAPEHHRRLEHDDAADADQAGEDADQDNRRARDGQDRPPGEEGELAPLGLGPEERRQADAQAIADQPNHRRLQE